MLIEIPNLNLGRRNLKLYCPQCQTEFPPPDVNVADNVGYCRQCGEAFRLSDLAGVVPAAAVAAIDPTTNIPKGCWYREEMDGWTAGATTRSPMAFFLVPFMCVWSGGSLGGIYGSQILAGKFNLGMSLFGIPFLLGSVLFWSIAAMTIAGKVILTANGNELTIFTGAWGLGWRRTVTITSDSRIDQGRANFRYAGGQAAAITIEGPHNIRFGSGLSFARQMFLIQLLRFKFNLPE